MSRGREREDYGPESAGVRNKVSVLVRNIPLTYTAEDLRAKFEKFGELRDVYIPRDYYTQRSRGFGFIEFRDQRDADEAIYQMDGSTVAGRKIEVCLSKEGRKTPREMMVIETKQTGSGRSGGGSDYDRRDRRRSRSPRRRSRSRSPRRGSRYSRSPRGRGGRDYDRERDRDYDRDRERDRDYGRERERDRDYDRDAGRDRERERDRDNDREHDRGARSGGEARERDNVPGSRSRSPRGDRQRSPPYDNQGASPREQREPGVGQQEAPPVEGEPPAAGGYGDYY